MSTTTWLPPSDAPPPAGATPSRGRGGRRRPATGWRTRRRTASTRAVEEAWATNLAVRSVFSALVVEHREDLCPSARQDLLAHRAALGRFGLDLAERVLLRS